MNDKLATARDLAIATLLILLVLLLHETYRIQHARLHIIFVPVLVLPVAYYSSVLGPKGAAFAAVLSALVIIDHVHDIHPLHLVLEVGLISSISLFGAAVATVANRDQAAEAAAVAEARRRVHELADETGYWDQVSLTRTGLYVTRIESQFIARSLERRPHGLTADIGAGSGRLHPAIVPRSAAVFATDVSTDALAAMKPQPNVTRLLVSARERVLPFASASLQTVIAVEVPAVSDEHWFRLECQRVLAPGGRAIITVHNALSYKGLISRLLRSLRAWRGQAWAGLYYRMGLATHVHLWREAGFRVRSSTGFYWAPFSRASNSTWLRPAAAIELLLGLRRLIGWSPWVLLELERETTPAEPGA